MPEQIKFLLATDTHVGYGENKKNIHGDSFVTFEEVLKNAAEKDVDFVLLGKTFMALFSVTCNNLSLFSRRSVPRATPHKRDSAESCAIASRILPSR